MELSTLTPWINTTALYTYRAYASWITQADVAGRLWLWAVENEEKIDNYLANPDGERIVRSILNQEARKYAIKERAMSTGYSPEDLTWYSPNMIKAALPDVFDYDDWQSMSIKGDTGGQIANAGGDRLAVILDIKTNLKKIEPMQQKILKLHYGDNLSIEACAIAFDIQKDAARKRIDRAVYALRDKMNGVREGDPYEAVNGQFDTRTRGRRAMSNAAARKATDNNWSE